VNGFGGYGGFNSTSVGNSGGDFGSLNGVTAESLAGMNALGTDDVGTASHTKAGGWRTPGYISAVMDVEAAKLSRDPWGTIKGYLPSAGKIGAYMGSGLGPLGMVAGYGVGSLVGAAINGDWGKMSPEERSDAIATAEAAMNNNGGGDGGGVSDTAPEDTASISPAPPTTRPWISPTTRPLIPRRSILDPKYDFNKQMIGLSARNVLPTRRR
jgi:hypothetical protein